MSTKIAPSKSTLARRKWVPRFFLAWAIFSTLWLSNSFRTQGLPNGVLEPGPTVAVSDQNDYLSFTPLKSLGNTALVFFCGSGVGAHAYAPMLRPIAEVGVPVFIIKLPLRFAPFDSHKLGAIERALKIQRDHPTLTKWVVSGHSLGAALACRVVQSNPNSFRSMVLLGTTHPKEDDLSKVTITITKVFGTADGVAPMKKVLANKLLLPPTTTWVRIEGGNHSQFGYYGHQLMDGTATVTREEQQRLSRAALLAALSELNKP
ncbi:MAG: alpha/beta fold hydrolase [Fimbriimonadaceae bacterium]